MRGLPQFACAQSTIQNRIRLVTPILTAGYAPHPHTHPLLIRHRNAGAKLNVIRAVARVGAACDRGRHCRGQRAVCSFLMMFSQFQIYDDVEGFIMSSVKTFLGGQALYDRTFTGNTGRSTTW